MPFLNHRCGDSGLTTGQAQGYGQSQQLFQVFRQMTPGNAVQPRDSQNQSLHPAPWLLDEEGEGGAQQRVHAK